MKLTAVLILGGTRYEKKLHWAEMGKPIWQIRPTEKQLASPQWLSQNGWEKRSAT
jgi:hypothetical protein